MPLTKKTNSKTVNKKNSEKKIDQLLEKLYYERDRPSALGGVEKMYRAARHYGLKRSQVMHWLQQQPGYTLHKPARKTFPRDKVFVNGLDEQWQCDLCDLTSLSQWNRGNKYILTCIDVLSKHAWAVAMKTKTGSALVAAFTKTFKQERKPEVLPCNHGIRHFVTYNETKAQIVDRFNRTVKQLMWRMFTTSRSYHYLDKLDSLVNDNNNQSVHRSIQMKFADVTVFNAQDVWKTLYGRQTPSKKYKFNLGDQVKISKYRKVFEKGYLPSWTEETFTITQRLPRNPPIYRLKEANDDLIQGTFYETELQRVIQKSNHLFCIEKSLKTRGKGGKKEVLVHWKSWSKSYDSWLPASQLVSLEQP